jgi:hypothetical protein
MEVFIVEVDDVDSHKPGRTEVITGDKVTTLDLRVKRQRMLTMLLRNRDIHVRVTFRPVTIERIT